MEGGHVHVLQCPDFIGGEAGEFGDVIGWKFLGYHPTSAYNRPLTLASVKDSSEFIIDSVGDGIAKQFT